MYRKIFKHLLDFFLAIILLALFMPLFLAIAIAVKLSSSGPVFFRQERGGKNGKYFFIFKFRSMAVDTDAEQKGFEPGSSMRVTGIGRILRKTKLDELPQLVNVLKGEVSFVGPRPEVRRYIELYPDRWEKVLAERPGITDPGSIEFRNEEELLAQADDSEKEYKEVILPRKLGIYESYVNSISLQKDLKIIVRTFFAVLFN